MVGVFDLISIWLSALLFGIGLQNSALGFAIGFGLMALYRPHSYE